MKKTVHPRTSAVFRAPDLLIQANEGDDFEDLLKVLEAYTADDLVLGRPYSGGTKIPKSAYNALTDLVRYLDKGNAVMMVPHGVELSSQAAANLLGISRPRLIQLEAEIPPSRYEGTHRRYDLAKVLAYRRQRIEKYEHGMKALRELTETTKGGVRELSA